MSPVIRISPMNLRVVRKRIGLTAQTAGCFRCEAHSPQSLPFIFVCLLLSSLFLHFSQFSPQRPLKAHLWAVIFLSDTVLSLTFLKENHSKAAQKQDFFNIQIKIHMLQFLSTLQTNHWSIINYKFQSLRQQSFVITLCRDITWVRN